MFLMSSIPEALQTFTENRFHSVPGVPIYVRAPPWCLWSPEKGTAALGTRVTNGLDAT